eukprot:TRINITY_DN8339_c0_g1_i1.p1 TRINITY_DN8339_c0_g1~~TRINITY_DN8339_c0_g1_i1.p1  ORF type:complete len:443 (-),score=108.56 TRINITY_DN8339_c0_g1_i1:72-1400(-)
MSAEVSSFEKQRWSGVYNLLQRPSLLFTNFVPDTEENPSAFNFIRNKGKVLIIGAGGLGCELLKNIALSGFKDIHVIDMDTIDATNLNRQFLFRTEDIGKPKAEVAAAFIQKRVPGVQITPHFDRIQGKSEDFYRQFALVVCGLDSVEARRWMNKTLCDIAVVGDDGIVDAQTVIPMVDGGSEGFKGHVRVILPFFNACFDCSLWAFPPATKFQLCTLADTPRLPEHCIEWASLLRWKAEKPFKKPDSDEELPIDTDNPEHMLWIYEKARERAEAHNIQGVTYKLTQGVVKNIIPAIAATNATIAAAIANEAFKIATNASGYLENFMMYNGGAGIYTHTFEDERKPGCPACGQAKDKMVINGDMTLEDFLELLKEEPRFQFKKPNIRTEETDENIYFSSHPQLAEMTKPNLSKKMRELIRDGDVLNVTDSLILKLTIQFKKD